MCQNKFILGVFITATVMAPAAYALDDGKFDADGNYTELVISGSTGASSQPVAASVALQSDGNVTDLIQMLNIQNVDEKLTAAKNHFKSTDQENLYEMGFVDVAIDFIKQCKEHIPNSYAYISRYRTGIANTPRYTAECISPNAISTDTNKNSYKWPQEIAASECSKIINNINKYPNDAFRQQLVNNIRATYISFSDGGTRYVMSPCSMVLPNTIAEAVVKANTPLSADTFAKEFTNIKSKCEKYDENGIKGVWIVDDFINVQANYDSTATQSAYCVFINTKGTPASRNDGINGSRYLYQTKLNQYVDKITAANGGDENWAYAPDNAKGLRCQNTFTIKKQCLSTLTENGRSWEHVIDEWTEDGEECQRKPEFMHVGYMGQDFPTGQSGNYTACEFSINVTKYTIK